MKKVPLINLLGALLIFTGLPVVIFLATHQEIFQQQAAQKTILTTKGVFLTPPNTVFVKNGTTGSGNYQIGGIITNDTVSLPAVNSNTFHQNSHYDITQIAPLPAVVDQGAIGSCVAWSTDYYMRGFYALRDGNYPTGKKEGFAPMYTFSQIDAPHGKVVGSSFPENFYYLMTQGVDTRSDYFQGDVDWKDTPTQNEKNNAANYKITGYKELFSGGPFTDIKQQNNAISTLENAVEQGNPVGITLVVNNSFMTASLQSVIIDDTGNPVAKNNPNEHIVTIWAYNDRRDAKSQFTPDSGFWIINSWGLRWGYNGKALLTMNFIKNRVKNAWIITGVQPPKPKLNSTKTNLLKISKQRTSWFQ